MFLEEIIDIGCCIEFEKGGIFGLKNMERRPMFCEIMSGIGKERNWLSPELKRKIRAYSDKNEYRIGQSLSNPLWDVFFVS